MTKRIEIKAQTLSVDISASIDEWVVPLWVSADADGEITLAHDGEYKFARSARSKTAKDCMESEGLGANALIIKHKERIYYSHGLPTDSAALREMIAAQVDVLMWIDAEGRGVRVRADDYSSTSVEPHIDDWVYVTNHSLHIDCGQVWATANDRHRYVTLFLLPEERGNTARAARVYAKEVCDGNLDGAIIAERRGQYWISNGWDPVADDYLTDEQLQRIVTHCNLVKVYRGKSWDVVEPEILPEEEITTGLVIPDRLERVLRDSSRQIADTYRALDASDLEPEWLRAITLAGANGFLNEQFTRCEHLSGSGKRAVYDFLWNIGMEIMPSHYGADGEWYANGGAMSVHDRILDPLEQEEFDVADFQEEE